MTLKTSIDALLQAGVQSGAVPGVVAMAADRDGIIYEGAFGERTLGSGQSMTLDTVGWIASMTKALTSVAAVQCVERGQLDLDAPASKVVPEIGHARVLTGFDADGLVVMEMSDGLGQRTEVRFSGWQRNPAFDAGTFAFIPPPGTEVVGEMAQAAEVMPLAD